MKKLNNYCTKVFQRFKNLASITAIGALGMGVWLGYYISDVVLLILVTLLITFMIAILLVTIQSVVGVVNDSI